MQNNKKVIAALDVDKIPAVNDKYKGWRGFVIVAFKTVFRLFCKIEYDDNFQEAFLKTQGEPTLLIANHQSFFDVPAIIAAAPLWIDWLCKVELFNIPLFKTFLLHWSAIPFNREGTDLRAVKTILRRLKQQRCVGIFPQGHRCKSYQDLLRNQANGSIINLARKSKAKIHLVGIEGDFKFGSTVKLHTQEAFCIEDKFAAEASDDKIAYDLMAEVYAMARKEYPAYEEMKAISETAETL